MNDYIYVNFFPQVKDKNMRASVAYEAIFVGGYVSILYYILRAMIGNINRPLFYFILGFIKHLFGYFSGMHQYFCDSKVVDNELLLRDSIIEGVIFIVISNIIVDDIAQLFIAGTVLHIISEITGIHNWFRKNRCR
jgi:hypothetical protein